MCSIDCHPVDIHGTVGEAAESAAIGESESAGTLTVESEC